MTRDDYPEGSDGEDGEKGVGRRQFLAMGGVGTLLAGGVAFERHRYTSDPYHPSNYDIEVTSGGEHLSRVELADHPLPFGPVNAHALEIVVADAFGDGMIYYELRGLEEPAFVAVRDRPGTGQPDLSEAPLPPEDLPGEYTVEFYEHDRSDESNPEPIAESTFTITHEP